MVDGIDITTLALGSYRSHLGLVLQESFLFDGTIHDNVAFGRPDATAEEVIKASRIAPGGRVCAALPGRVQNHRWRAWS